ncbi:type IV pilus modification protein PilV [Paraherbaspirillum soli]|uniref:Type IV pilus modification protein PilV n=1 Tax=Paraherbaspirillum soli TaxID=631222 RepID=A0ABW0M9B9_9BURK
MLIKKHKSGGFSMLEVLVTLVIILLGVLGMAGMQMLAINNTQIARTHSLAAILASSLTAEMQANQPYWSTSTTSGKVSGVSAKDWTNTTLGDSTLNGLSTDCTAGTCAAAEMAAYDLKAWGANVATLLPAGAAQVACNGATPNVCTVSVSWNEKNVALHNMAAGATVSGALATGTIQSQSYTTFANIN